MPCGVDSKMVLALQGKKDKTIRMIFHTSIGWKCLFHTYRLSNKGTVVYASTLSKEIGHNVSNVRKVLGELEDLGLITKTKIQQTEIIYISKIELTPYGEGIASYIYNIVKLVFKSPDSNIIESLESLPMEENNNVS